jgi:hypothetical protein
MKLRLSFVILLVAGLCIMSCSKEGPIQSAPEGRAVLAQAAGDFDSEVIREMHEAYYRTHGRPILKTEAPGEHVYDETVVNVAITDPPDGFSTEDECITVTGTASAVGGAEIDLHLILDSSGSLSWNDSLDFREQASVALIQSFNPLANLRIGTVDFDTDAFVASPLTLIGDDLGAAAIAAVQGMDQSGGTDIAEGILVTVDDFIANGIPGASWVSILFSDGESSVQDAIDAADSAASVGVVINTVFLGAGSGATLMQDIATATGGFYLSTEDPQDLIDIFGSIPVTGIDEVRVNGILANLVAGVFDAYICLDCGENEIVAVATATDGTTGSDTIYVTRECIVEVPFDVKPTSCPNPLNVKSGGVLPVAILGTMDLDVTTIDPASLEIRGVAPISWDLEDVATPYVPYVGKMDCMECNELGPDGYTDLTLKFDKQAIVATLCDPQDGECLVLAIEGLLFDDTQIMGEDVVRLVVKGKDDGGKGPTNNQ